MTPKEKAKELVDKFQDIDIESNDSIEGNYYMSMSKIDAKDCALLATNEVIDTLYEYHYDSASGAYEFWTEVKEELEKRWKI